MNEMIVEIPYVLLVGGGALLGLYLANLFYDTNVIAHHVSRKLGHLGGCVGFLLCPFLFKTFWWPLVLVTVFTGILLYARWRLPHAFRGTGGSGRPQALAEVHFPATGIITIGIGWGILNQPWMAVVPLLFMGGGDAVTGLVRNRLYNREMKGNWGSVAMACACLLFAYFIHPYYIGLAGAAAAVLVERFTPAGSFNLGQLNIKFDDNLSIPIVSFAVMVIAMGISGRL